MAKLELDASKKGWRCSDCGLSFDCIGRPLFGDEAWIIQPRSNTWLENKPQIKYCPGCGQPIGECERNGEKE